MLLPAVHWEAQQLCCAVDHVSTKNPKTPSFPTPSVNAVTISLLPNRLKGIFNCKKKKEESICEITELNHLGHTSSSVCYMAIMMNAVSFSFNTTIITHITCLVLHPTFSVSTKLKYRKCNFHHYGYSSPLRHISHATKQIQSARRSSLAI